MTWILLGATFGALFAANLFPPLDEEYAMVPALILLFGGLALAGFVGYGLQRKRKVGHFREWMWWLAIPQIVLAVGVFLNGAHDMQESAEITTEFLRIERSRRSTRLIVQSWRTPGDCESLPLCGKKRETLYPGNKVKVKVREGFFGYAWVETVERVTPHAP